MRTCPKCGARYADDLAYCPNDGTATQGVGAPATDVDPFVGATIDGRYRIESRIGEGGMGVVYRASHVVLKKALAIKVMRGEQANDPEVVQRFVQEAQSASAIGHPNIIGITDFGTTSDGAVYFAMEHLQGQTLGKAMEQGPLAHERAFDILAQISSALEAAHQRGIVHRDLKPDNIFLVRQDSRADFVKVLDFGIAKVKNAAAKITRTGMVFGTPHYMSPEQAAGQTVDHRSDIYSLGVIMYQLFVGQLPFDAASYMGVITKHLYDEPVPPSRIVPQLRGPIEDVILKALAKKPEHRYSSMLELKADLERARHGEPLQVSPRTELGTSDTLTLSSTLAPLRPSALGDASGRPTVQTLSEIKEETTPAVVPRKRTRVWLWPALSALVLAGLVVVFMPRREEHALMPAPVAKPAAAVGAPVNAPAGPAPAPDAPAQPAEPIRIRAEPSGAHFFAGDMLLGDTEARVARPAQGQVRVAVRRAGYFPKEVVIENASPELITVILEAEAARKPEAKLSPSKPHDKPEAKRGAPRRAPSGLSDVVDPWR